MFLFNVLDTISAKLRTMKNLYKNCILFFLATLLLGTIVLMLVCGLYIWPDGNDLVIASEMHALSENKNLFTLLKNAFKIAGSYYFTHSGCYTSYFFTTLQPFVVFGREYFILNVLILIIGNVFGILYFTKTMLTEILSVDKKSAWLCSLGVLTLCMQFVPSAYMAYFWFNGSFYNTMSFSAMLIYVALETKMIVKKQRGYDFLILGLLGIFIGGANYATSMVLIGYNILLNISTLGSNKRTKKDKICLIMTQLVHLICFLAAVAAPGNRVRMQSFEQRNVILAILYSFVYALRHIFDYMSLPVIFIILILGIYIYTLVRDKKYQYRYPAMICLISFCFFAMTEAPTSYGESCMPPLRQVNIQVWLLWMLAIVNVVYFAGWIDNEYISKIKCSEQTKKVFFSSKTKASLFGILSVIMLLICWKPDELTCSLALKSVLELKEFKIEREERWKLLEDEETDVVVFAPFEHLPEIFNGLNDLREPDAEVGAWINEAFAMYYGKQKVYLQKQGNEEREVYE